MTVRRRISHEQMSVKYPIRWRASCTSREKIRAALALLEIFLSILYFHGITKVALLFSCSYLLRMNSAKLLNFITERCNVRFHFPWAFVIRKLLPFHKIFFPMFYFPGIQNSSQKMALEIWIKHNWNASVTEESTNWYGQNMLQKEKIGKLLYTKING